ncbi:MAG: hypothetical protein L0Y66_16390 [Myxococcaceae bacterium]|nr:hypothetical protein [Myxococcaceae bacterium]MCI0671565.1 hypothetical protein [Myxococcaceae bacterium]
MKSDRKSTAWEMSDGAGGFALPGPRGYLHPMPATKKRPALVPFKKHWAPAATGEEIRKAAGISDKQMRAIRARLIAHGIITKDAPVRRAPSAARRPKAVTSR